MKRRLFIAFIAVMGLLLAACSDDTTDNAGGEGTTPPPENNNGGSDINDSDIDTGAVMKFGFSSPLQTIDPHFSGSAQFPYVMPVFEGLIEMSAAGELQPRLATEWELSDDGLQFDITIREGVKFHDGSDLDADVVKANLDRAMEEGTTTAAMLTDISSVEVLDATHVRLNLETPGGRIPSVLAERAGFIVASDAIASGDVDANPIGTGPFTVRSVSDALVVYERNNDYWQDDLPAIAGLEIHVMGDDSARLNGVRSGELDMTHIRPQQRAEAEDAGLQVVVAPGVSQYGIFLNPSYPPLDNPEVRKAISFAIDRDSIDAALFSDGCTPNGQLVPSGTWAYSDDLEEDGWGTYDPDRAKELLADAGFADGFDFELTTYSVTSYQRMAEAIQAQLGDIGIKTTISVADAAQMHPDWRSGKLASWLAIYYPARPDPTVFLSDYLIDGGAYNPGDFSVEGVDALNLDSLSYLEEAERAPAILEAIEAIYDAGSPVVPVCDPVGIVAATPKVVNAAPPYWGNYDFLRYAIER